MSLVETIAKEATEITKENTKDAVLEAKECDYANADTYETVRSLYNKLKYLKGAITRNNVVPVLENIKFEGYTMVTTDLQVTLGVETDIEGKFLIPFDKLYSVVSKIKDKSSRVSFSVDNDETSSNVKVYIDGKSAFTFTGIETTKKFPIMPVAANYAGVANAEVLDLIAKCVPFCSQDELRPNINSVCLDCDRIAATDGHAMFYSKFDKIDEFVSSRNGLPLRALIPSRAAKLLSTIGEMGDSELKMHVKDDDAIATNAPFSKVTNILFSNKSRFLMTRCLDERFPEYENVIPSERDQRIRITTSKKQLKNLLDMAMIAANKATNAIQFKHTITPSGISYFMFSMDLETDSSFEREIEGASVEILNQNVLDTEPFSFALNGKLLDRAISASDGDNITLKACSPRRAIMINDNQLIMPIVM